MFSGMAMAMLGAMISAILGGIGSAYGVQVAGRAAAGVTAEKPEYFGKMLIFQALPGTQGIYGFLTAVLIMVRCGMLGGSLADITAAQGMLFLLASLPVGIVGLFSGIYQGKTAVASIHMTAKQPDAAAKGITMTAIVETYAILALLVSILLVYGIQL